jgi:hypothetical protein
MTTPTPLLLRRLVRVLNMALNGHEERLAEPDGPPAMVKGRALLGPTEFPVQHWKPILAPGEVAHRTRAGKWLIDYQAPA